MYACERVLDTWDGEKEEEETDLVCRYIPFSGGPRKCVGDQFALMEAVVALAVVLKRFTFKAVPGHDVGMTTGATIHTQNGLYMNVYERSQAQSTGAGKRDLATAAA